MYFLYKPYHTVHNSDEESKAFKNRYFNNAID